MRFPAGASRRSSRGAGSSGGLQRPNRLPVPRQGRHFVRSASLIQPVVNGYQAYWLTNDSTFTTNTQPTVQYVATKTGGGTIAQVQVQWAHQTAAFAAFDFNGSTTNMGPTYTMTNVTSGATTNTSSPTPLDTFPWYARVRAGDGTNWGRWTAPLRVVIMSQLLSAAAYFDENVGIGNVVVTSQSGYFDENVGINPGNLMTAGGYFDENVGINPGVLFSFGAYFDENVGPQIDINASGTAYFDENVDSTLHPTPALWWIVPTQGKEGWIFHLFGHGFGPDQATYGGKVLINGLECGIISWTREASTLQQNYETFDIRPGSVLNSLYTAQLGSSFNGGAGVGMVTGDYITWDEYWSSPAGTNLGFAMGFLTSANGDLADPASAARVDDNGLSMKAGTNNPNAYGTWVTRKFTIPAGLNGNALMSARIWLKTMYTGQATATVRVRNVGLMNSSGGVKQWIVPPTISAPLTLGAPINAQNGSTVLANTVVQESLVISPGTGLDDQVTLPEHGHIVVSVPTGAESGPVKVRLTI